jgi:predicted NACHT family NTPase
MKPLIIAVAGKKLAGKSTLCQYLAKAYALRKNFPNLDIELFQDETGNFSARQV